MKNLILVSALVISAATAALAQHPAAPAKGIQKATIVVDHGFKPAKVSFKAGQPVQLTFDTKHRDCATSVVFDGMNLEKPLTDGKKTVITFTPKKAGTFAFACPMKMMNGTLIVK